MTGLRWTMIAASAAALVAGCAAAQDHAGHAGHAGHAAAAPAQAQADLRTSAGADAGKAIAEVEGDGLKVTVDVVGIPAGVHGVHVHTTGKCDSPDFATAGGHWNPTTHKHGLENAEGPHAGDMPNLTVGADGRGQIAFKLPAGTLAGLLDADGAAFVVHAGPDDMKTDPSGNSGGRIACGVFAGV